MIELVVEDYCQNGCDNFEPVKEDGINMYNDGVVVATSATTVHCRHARKCQCMMTYLNAETDKKAREAYAKGVAAGMLDNIREENKDGQ